MKEIQRIYIYIFFFCIPRHFIFSKNYFWFLPSPFSLCSLFLERLFRLFPRIKLSLLEKNFGFSSRSIIFIQLQFSSCLNYFRIIQPQIYLFIHFSFLNFIDFITSIISMHFFFAQNLLRFHYPRDIKLDRIFENNQSSRWVSPNSNNFRPRQLFLSIRTCERYWYWPIFNEY